MPMTETNWYKTDNVAKVFLATLNRRDTRSLRIGCTLNEKVDPDILEKALLNAIRVRPQFQVRIRRGFFWHYLETTDYVPNVLEEKGRPCPILYGGEYNGTLHYQVSYFNKRINLDMFHALSDGTGALEFLNVIVSEYLKLLYPEELEDITSGSDASAGDLAQDSFDKFYDKTGNALETVNNRNPNIPRKAYHIHSLRLPYDQLQFLEIKMDSSVIRAKSKECGVGLTAYLGARIMFAVYKDMPYLKRKQPITVSIPVNLRNYYPSQTARNFFNSVKITHSFDGSETIESLSKELDQKIHEALNAESIKMQMDGYQKVERLLFVRMVPLAIKQPVVKLGSKSENKSISFVFSNMGQIKIDDKLKPHIKAYTAICSHNEMFVTAYSYDNTLTLGVTYGFIDTSVLKNFVRGLTEEGVEISVNATEVVR